MNIGLFFGSFNPIHLGHLFIANHMAQLPELDEVWFIVSPQNPFKEKKNLLPEYDRLHLVNLAIEDNDKLRAKDFEFYLPKPSYTIDTLVYLEEKYPKHNFALIMGADNLPTLPKWKNGDVLMKNYKIYVYNRPGTTLDVSKYPGNIVIQETPQVYLSASHIREQIKAERSIKYLVPPAVEEYILDSGWYK
ncbi:MAG: nicotinate-nucleotide adenylyltransferase [Chitinophagales bacterium]|jgi:nicotinate-nucleotide adenylyltransferase